MKPVDIKIIGYMFSIMFNIILYITFLYAYFCNNHRFSITINDYGEAHIELVILIILFPIMLLGLYYTVKE